MLHPSYRDLMKVANSEVEEGQEKVVNSRYSIVMATSKRARQIVDGSDPLVDSDNEKPLSIAIDEFYHSKIKIGSDEEPVKEETAGEASDEAEEVSDEESGEQPEEPEE